jgi:microcystin degradation protein MlrC
LYLEGEEITADARSEHPRLPLEVVGFYAEMDRLGAWEPVPILVTMGGAGGAADHSFFVATIDRVRSALDDAGPLDAVYLCNHGAMITTEEPDGDGAFFEAIRDAVGPDVPLVGTLDPHGNVSDLMVESLDVVVAYRTDPHVDQLERGGEAAVLLHEMWSGMMPYPVFVKLPIVAPNVALFTDAGAFAALLDAGQQGVNDDICNVSILGGFAFSDTAKNGLAIVVTGRNDDIAARDLARDLADQAWADRLRFVADAISIDDAVELAIAAGRDPSLPPMVMSDLGDNCGAGGPANTVWMLEALHQADARGVLIVNFRDRHLVSAAQSAGVGNTFDAIFSGDDWGRGGEATTKPLLSFAPYTKDHSSVGAGSSPARH